MLKNLKSNASISKILFNIEKTIKVIDNYSNTFRGIELNEEKNAIELFALTSIYMTKQHLNSIQSLLKNDILTDCFILCRVIVELQINLHWANTPDKKNDKNRRVLELQAKPYNDFEKGIKYSISRLKEKSDSIPEVLKQEQDAIKQLKYQTPELLVDPKNLNSKFKVPSDWELYKKIDPDDNHIYRLFQYFSMYSHPNPATKEFFVQRIGGDNRGYSQNMIIQLETSIVHVYYYLNILFEDIQILLGYFKPEYSKKRELSLDKLKEVFLNLNNGHFKPKKIDTVT